MIPSAVVAIRAEQMTAAVGKWGTRDGRVGAVGRVIPPPGHRPTESAHIDRDAPDGRQVYEAERAVSGHRGRGIRAVGHMTSRHWAPVAIGEKSMVLVGDEVVPGEGLEQPRQVSELGYGDGVEPPPPGAVLETPGVPVSVQLTRGAAKHRPVLLEAE